ncbi:MAG: hypothetical protein GX579_17135 [Chloroflexi bacterium]|nr:hypothetical protein [Chloroflexota bacterium]
MKPRLTLLLLLLLLLAVACGPSGGSGDPTAELAPDEATATAPVAAPPTADETIEAYPAPTQLPTPTAFPDDYPMPPTPTPAPTFDPYPGPDDDDGTVVPESPGGEATAAAPTGGLPPGLVYEADDATWLVRADGAPTGLAPRTGLEVSPDGSRAAYLEGDDIFILNLETDEATNITGDSDRPHTVVTWWPARPDTLLALSRDPGDIGPNLGRLTLLAADGATYEVLGETASNAMPAGSHDGTRIAYDEGGQPFIYDVDAGAREPFDPAAFTLPEGVTVTRAASPAWSPDDSAIAWMMGIEREGEPEGEEIALGIFDLQAGTAQIIHPYVTLGRGGWLIAPTWSPDGAWVVFPVETGDADRGMWVTAADGSSEQLLGGDTFSPVFWLPDSSAVLVSIPQQATMDLAQYTAPAWEETLLGLTHTRLPGWVEQ